MDTRPPLLDESNFPHLVLGMRSDRPTTEATECFARATKQARRNPTAPFSIEQLTSALAKVENSPSIDSPIYRVPANPQLFGGFPPYHILDGQRFESGDDLLAVVGKWWSPNTNSEELGRVALNYAVNFLFDWRFVDARTLALDVLRLARTNEAIRDEAMNVLAAAHCMLGEPEKALDALRHAVEGEANLALQLNLAIVAKDLDPELSAEQARFPIEAAPDIERRLAASWRAINLWYEVQGTLTGSDDTDDFKPIPSSLLGALFTTIADRELPEEDFFRLGKVVAEAASAEFTRSGCTDLSPWRHTPSAELLTCRAKGFSAFIENIVRIAKRAGAARPWIDECLEEIIDEVGDALLSDPRSEAGLSIGIDFIDQGLDLSTPSRVALRALTIGGLTLYLNTSNSVPDERFVDLLVEAKRRIQTIASQAAPRRPQPDLWTDSVISELRTIFHPSANTLAAAFHDFIGPQIRECIHALQSIESQMSTVFRRMAADKGQISRAARLIEVEARKFSITLQKLVEIAEDRDLLTALNDMKSTCNSLQTLSRQYI